MRKRTTAGGSLGIVALLVACASTAPPDASVSFDASVDASSSFDGEPDSRAPMDDAGPLPAELARTSRGLLRGVPLGDDIVAFHGVRYARAPTGARRFVGPQPLDAWDGERAADTRGPACPQVERGVFLGDEDCLAVEIWTHRDRRAPRPVLVFLPGGGFHTGYASYGTETGSLYDGVELARATGAVVVVVTYRVGTLGLWTHEDLAAEEPGGVFGNVALQDQRAALRFVHDEIAALGGDPDRVLLFGESAGAFSVCAHLAATPPGELFSRAIVESGSCEHFPPLRDASASGPSVLDAARVVTEAAGCATDALACMRALPAETVTRAFLAAPARASLIGEPALFPAVGGALMPELPLDAIRAGRWADVPVIAGSNADEGASFTGTAAIDAATLDAILARGRTAAEATVLRDLYSVATFGTAKAAWEAAITDVYFHCPSLSLVEAATGSRLYRFDMPLVAGRPPRHLEEVLYVFDTFQTYEVVPMARHEAIVAWMQSAWGRFAATAQPQDDWPVYTLPDTTMIIDDLTRLGAPDGLARCAMLRDAGVLR